MHHNGSMHVYTLNTGYDIYFKSYLFDHIYLSLQVWKSFDSLQMSFQEYSEEWLLSNLEYLQIIFKNMYLFIKKNVFIYFSFIHSERTYSIMESHFHHRIKKVNWKLFITLFITQFNPPPPPHFKSELLNVNCPNAAVEMDFKMKLTESDSIEIKIIITILFIKESCRKCHVSTQMWSSTIDCNINNEKCFLSSRSSYQNNFWRSCDTEDWRNDAEFIWHHTNTLHFKIYLN